MSYCNFWEVTKYFYKVLSQRKAKYAKGTTIKKRDGVYWIALHQAWGDWKRSNHSQMQYLLFKKVWDPLNIFLIVVNSWSLSPQRGFFYKAQVKTSCRSYLYPECTYWPSLFTILLKYWQHWASFLEPTMVLFSKSLRWGLND